MVIVEKNIVEVVVVSEIVASLYKGSSNFYSIDVISVTVFTM